LDRAGERDVCSNDACSMHKLGPTACSIPRRSTLRTDAAMASERAARAACSARRTG
jgi:hypothetical protein